jgi:hypothetical protein
MSTLLKQVAEPQDNSIRHIPLTQGQVAIVDTADYEWLSQWKWHACWNASKRSFYAVRRNRKEGTVRMHRLILAATSQDVDHRNGFTLDNRRNNLRECTHQQNCANQSKKRNNKSGYRGVYKHSSVERWVAQIQCGKMKKIGHFYTPEDAARAYDKAATEYFGEFAKLNFPHIVTE